MLGASAYKSFEEMGAALNTSFLNDPPKHESPFDALFMRDIKSTIRAIVATEFPAKKITAHFYHGSASSVVVRLENGEEKYVLRIPLPSDPDHHQNLFLNEWKKYGVRVPQILKEGSRNDVSYTLMECIDARPLASTRSHEEMVANSTYTEMGKLLRSMHESQGVGFGEVIENRGTYDDFASWIASESIQKRVMYVKERKLLDVPLLDSIEQAQVTLHAFALHNSRSTYCHNDFSPSNVFDTQPLIVFDPSPLFDLPVMDLARSVVQIIGLGAPKVAVDQLVEGYGLYQAGHEKEALHAAVLLHACLKISYWHQTNQSEKMNSMKNFLNIL